jgi:methylated-DNA-protein-cysteine methyltransferase-like protein
MRALEGANPVKRDVAKPTPFEEVYRIVERIPRGRVATYGQISRMLDGRYSPLFVGWALHAVPGERAGLPWHRVINSKGGVSTRQVLGYAPDLQKLLLVEEGIVFDENDRCDLESFQWDGDDHDRIRRSPGGRTPRAPKRA